MYSDEYYELCKQNGGEDPGGVMLMERDEVMQEIEESGMFLYAFPAPAEG